MCPIPDQLCAATTAPSGPVRVTAPAERPMPPEAEPPLQMVLTCGDSQCQHTFEPDPDEFATVSLACPVCGGWTLHAEPSTPGGGR